MLYVIVFGGALGVAGGSTDDLIFFLRSAGVYGLAFSALLAATAINNERRSRRILAVLSKGIERGHYLAGLLGGALLAAGSYCVVVALIGTAALVKNGVRPDAIWALVTMLLALYALAATTALFFSTFLHPLFATAAAAGVLAGTGALGNALGGAWRALLPAHTLVDATLNFGAQNWQLPAAACGWAVLEAVVMWGVATAVFSRRDIAVTVE